MVSRRGYANEKDQPPAGNDNTSLHISEEQAEISRIKGETEPDIGQGTPVQEVRGRLSNHEIQP